MRLAVAILLIFSASSLAAEPLAESPLPTPRPDPTSETALTEAENVTQPRPRPDAPTARQLQPAVSAGSDLARAQLPQTGLEASPRPNPRPARRVVRVQREVSPEPARVLRSGEIGPICGVGDIIGRDVDPIPGRLRGCGVAEPVRISQVAGVRLSHSATMDCPTARALRSWVEGGVKPAVGSLGGGAARLEVAAGYVCRTINHRPGGSISEHGKGKAIDISGVTLRNGRTITVSNGWRSASEGEILREMHRAACGPFGTVLGPAADRYHQNHFHFDSKARRSPYCR